MNTWHPEGVVKALYACSKCDKSYSCSRSLDSHRRRKHPSSGLPQVTAYTQHEPSDPSQNEHDLSTAGGEGGADMRAPNLPADPVSTPTNPASQENDVVAGQLGETTLAVVEPGQTSRSPARPLTLGSENGRTSHANPADCGQSALRSSPTAPVLLSSSSLKRKRDESPKPTSTAQANEGRNGSAERQIVADSLQKAYENVLGDTLRENIRLKQDNVVLQLEIEELKKKIENFETQNNDTIEHSIETQNSDKKIKNSSETQSNNNEIISSIESDEIDEKVRITFGRESSLLRLNNESAKLRAHTELPTSQSFGPRGQDRTVRPIEYNQMHGMNQQSGRQNTGPLPFWHTQSPTQPVGSPGRNQWSNASPAGVPQYAGGLPGFFKPTHWPGN